MALTPYQTDALIREVDEAVRQDDMMSFWTRYGRMVVIAVIAALAAFGGWLLWQNHRTTTAEAHGEQFADLIKTAQSGTLDQPVFDKLVAEGGPAYKAQAQLVKAALAAGKGDAAGATTVYDAIIADAGTPQPMKEAALIRKTALGFDAMKPDAAIAALKDLAVPGNPWFGSAGELTAVAYLRMGRRDLAGETFAAISRDLQVPESIRVRAGQMASMLGSLSADPAAEAAVTARK